MAGALLTSLVIIPNLLFQAGMDFMAAYTALCIASVAGTAWLAYCRLPYLAFPSVAVTGWLVYLVIISRGFSWQQVLGLSAIVSLLGLGLFLSKWGQRLLAGMPPVLSWAMKPAVGLLLILLGLTQGRIIVASPWSVTMLGDFQDPLAYLGTTGLVIGMALLVLKTRDVLAWSFLLTALLALAEGFWVLPEAPVILPEGMDKVIGQLSCSGSAVDAKPVEYIGTGLALLLVVNSQSVAMLNALGQKEKAHGLMAGLAGISFLGTFLGSLPLSVSPLSAIAKTSSAGRIKAVLTCVSALAVLMFFEPVAAALAKFPVMAVPVLVLSGLFLCREAWEEVPRLSGSAAQWEEFLPAACVLVIMPLSWNIAAGLGAGLICWTVAMLLAGRGREVAWSSRVLSLCFLMYFLLGDI